MKNFTIHAYHMYEQQAIFQSEYSYSEARPFQDKHMSVVGLIT